MFQIVYKYVILLLVLPRYPQMKMHADVEQASDYDPPFAQVDRGTSLGGMRLIIRIYILT